VIYELTDSLFDNHINNDFKDCNCNYIYSNFNQKIDLPHNLTHLTLLPFEFKIFMFVL